MGITNVKTKGVVVNLIQQKLDGKLLPSVFRDRNVSKNRFGIITKDMWYKLHPIPYRRSKNDFACTRTVFCPLGPDDGYDGYDR